MFNAREGSTARLIHLCVGYFSFYVITGVTLKWFTSAGEWGAPRMANIEFLVYSTIGGNALCLAWVFLNRWYRLKSAGTTTLAGLTFPMEFLYIVPSGFCTAWVIVSTTLNYMLLPSVMVAMVITRGCVIVVSRAVDAVQIAQGVLKKKVYWQEDVAVVIAVLAVAGQILCHFAAPTGPNCSVLLQIGQGDSVFWIGWISAGEGARWTTAALVVLLTYVMAYACRIYIMNYFKNTRGKSVPQDNKGFFAIEQIAAAVAIVAGALAFFVAAPNTFSTPPQPLEIYRHAITEPHALWGWAIVAGMAYGGVAFFSVFIFMFKGRTATFAGLVNRLTSLLAGTSATLILHWFFKLKFPKPEDWVSFCFILVAVGFLTMSEQRRVRELSAARELETTMDPAAPSAAK